MHKSLIFGAALATFSSLTISFPVEAQSRINELQRTRGTTISGQVTSVVGNDFTIDDGTGQVIVDAGPRWYQPINISPGERVTVVGEMDEGEFDAFSITKSNGTVVKIRSPFGPPPWAGGRGRRAPVQQER